MTAIRINRSFIVKLASSCTHRCTYCYWFRDQEVYQLPALMSRETQDLLVARVEEYVRECEISDLKIYFHGGEPLLFGRKNLRRLIEALSEVGTRHAVAISFGITTNGVLIDDAYAALFKEKNIGVSLSLDGPKSIHDQTRVDLKGRGTYDATVTALNILRKHDCRVSVLTVINPASSPAELIHHFVQDLNITFFDVLIPYCNHDERAAGQYQSIAGYLTELFDIWYDKYSDRVQIRLLNSLVSMLLSQQRMNGNIGLGMMNIFSINTNGEYEPHDGLRIGGADLVRTRMNLRDHRIADILTNDLWRQVAEASLQLAGECQSCSYRPVCGGGNVINRFSSARGYDNPSVYCDDFKRIIEHVFLKMLPDLKFGTGT